MELSFFNWFLAILPVLVLLLGLLAFKWEVSKVGALSWGVAVVIALTVFGCDFKFLAIADSKGMSLSVYVLTIIWGAVFLYNIADSAGAIKVIGNSLAKITDDKDIRCLLLAWCFTCVLQGLAGFGVPVAVVAPIMVVMGFEPMTAVVACLVGHSWAISFGSMGSSFNTIQLVTGLPGDLLGPQMALLFSVGIFATGCGVMHVFRGWAGVKANILPILTTGGAMSFCLWFMNYIGAAQLASLLSGLSGCAVLFVWSIAKNKKANASLDRPVPAAAGSMKILVACAPYLLLISLSVLSQVKVIKSALSRYGLGLSYPKTVTAFGYAVGEVKRYSEIKLFSHPAPILLVSALVGYCIYIKAAKADKGILGQAAKNTVTKCIPTSIGIITMVMMALIMSDSGMTNIIARGAATVLGGLYPFASPFIGALGSFITGSNTNSNIMFGMLQYEIASVLGRSTILLCAAQSVGGSLGIPIAPSAIMMGAANVGLGGKENDVLKVTIRYTLINLLLIGIAVWLFA